MGATQTRDSHAGCSAWANPNMTYRLPMPRRLQVLLLSTLLYATLCLSPSAGQHFGITTGMTFDRLSSITLDNVTTRFDSKVGWVIGVWMEAPFGPFGVQIGVRYLDTGRLFEGLVEDQPLEDTHDHFDFSFVEVPLLIRYSLGTPVLSPYAFAGPLMRFPTALDAEIAEDVKTLSLAIELGAGIKLKLGKLSLLPEIAYAYGITNFIGDSIHAGPITLDTTDKQSLNSAMLRLSLGF